VPRLEEYAWRLWDYWERHLDPDLFIDRSLASKVRDKVAVVTGGTSGIGEATAYKLAEAGAQVVVVARDPEKAEPVMQKLKAMGARAKFISCDLSSLADCDKLVAAVLEEFGRCDFLVNNAGRSIRRGIASSYDRFHDFERTMQLNYFGSLRLIMGFMPSMVAQGGGHIVNISSIGVLTRAPRFSAYVASKAALDAWTRCASSEYADLGITFTTFNMPLVRTPMIAPTGHYKNFPAKTPEEAAGMIAEAITGRQKRVSTQFGRFSEVTYATVPAFQDAIVNAGYQLFPEGDAGRTPDADTRDDGEELTPEQRAFERATRGAYW
jgi:NAD(P)-dependent dehydrogenase (short-subunit alcohol dehydrogenase family)